MKPKRIILIRHGESQGNVDDSIYNIKPDYTLELTESGKCQAKNAGKELKEIVGNESLFFYVSPLWRTRETFENIAQSFHNSQYQYREEPRLREQEWGHLRSVEESEKINQERDEYGTFYYRIPDGESAADVYDRVSDFFGTLYRDFEKADFPENVCVVTHGMTMRLFLMRWFHWTVEKFEGLGNPHNCQLLILEKNVHNKYELTTPLKTTSSRKVKERPIKLLPHL
jgi:broad specificity phosphatase PhoE